MSIVTVLWCTNTALALTLAGFAVFSPLYTTKADGLGMGLTISRTIIEAHGGRLWALNSATTSGAVFRFTLPRA
jgi:signal transduction histidine kinase